ncbi:MAG: SDR family oxidoreductase [Desulforhopalus sp.]
MSYLDEMFGLHGKTAVVAGGAGAIGTVMSEALLRAGAKVMIWSRSRESLDLALEKMAAVPDSNDRISGLQVDAGNEERVREALLQTVSSFSVPDILVNGVGGNIGKSPLIEQDMEVFAKVLHMNLVAGLMIPTKVFGDYWIHHSHKGCIINLTSMASYNPLSGVWAYDAAKSATLNLTMASANEFAEYGIRVNAIAPGFFIGKQNKALLIDEKTGKYTDRGKAVIAHTPFGRFGNVMELAGATVFLASDQAAGFITGVSLPVDGGYLIHNI